MKRKIFSVLFALVLVLSFSLVTAVPVAAVDDETPAAMVFPFELGGKSAEAYVAEWSTGQVNNGCSSVNLATTGTVGTGDEARIRIDFSAFPEGDTPELGDIETISWYEYLVAGYPPHVDVYLDIDGDGTADDALVIEYAYNSMDHVTAGWPTYGAVTDDWFQTFNDDGDGPAVIDDDAYAWLTSRAAGPVGGEFGDDDHWGTTLADWKAGKTTPAGDISADTVVTALEIEVDNWIVQSEAYVDDITINGMLVAGQIQDAVDTVGTDALVVVMPGTYDEQVVIDKSLTLVGSGDATVIQPSGADILTTVKITPWLSGGTKQMAAIVFVDTATPVMVMDLKIDGSLLTEVPVGVGGDWVAGLAYLETSGTVANLTVVGNPNLACRTAGIWASAVTTESLVAVTGCNVIGYNRAGIYAVGGTLTADYQNNEINGPGELIDQVPNGIYFLVNAKGKATYNIVTDLAYTGEQYLSTGIGVYEAGEDILFSNNEISNVQMAFCLAKDSSGTTVENNDIHDCHTGVKIEFGAASHTIRYNDIHDNDFAIRCDDLMGDGNVAHFNNFVDNSGAEWTNVGEGRTYVGAVCNIHETYGLNAGMNYWGDISGPTFEGTGQYYSGADSDSVSDNVGFEPWLTRDIETVKADEIAYQGFRMVWLNTGWNTFSTPIALDPGCDEWDEYVALGDGLNIHATSPAYAYDPTVPGGWMPLIGVDADYPITPCDAIYVRMAAPDVGAVLLSPDVSVPSKDLYVGWNLVGLGWMPEGPVDAMSVTEALSTVYTVTGDLTGYSLVVSPPVNGEQWFFTRDGEEEEEGIPVEAWLEDYLLDDLTDWSQYGGGESFEDWIDYHGYYYEDLWEDLMDDCYDWGLAHGIDMEYDYAFWDMCYELVDDALDELDDYVYNHSGQPLQECFSQFITQGWMHATKGYWVFMINDGMLAGFTMTPMPFGMQ